MACLKVSEILAGGGVDRLPALACLTGKTSCYTVAEIDWNCFAVCRIGATGYAISVKISHRKPVEQHRHRNTPRR